MVYHKRYCVPVDILLMFIKDGTPKKINPSFGTPYSVLGPHLTAHVTFLAANGLFHEVNKSASNSVVNQMTSI
jgi:hypothetical protein